MIAQRLRHHAYRLLVALRKRDWISFRQMEQAGCLLDWWANKRRLSP